MPSARNKQSSTSLKTKESTNVTKSDTNISKTGSSWKHEHLAQVKQRVIEGHTEGVNSIQFCFNDERLLSGSTDGTYRIWDFVSGEQVQCVSAHESRMTAARTNNTTSDRVVTAGWDKKIHLWDTETGQCLWTGAHDGIVSCVAMSNDGRHVVSGSDMDFVVRVWDTNTGDVTQVAKGLHTSTLTDCKFSPKDDRIITTSMDMSSKFWDRRMEATTLTLGGHINIISCCSITKDEKRFATASWDKTLKLWDITTGAYRSHGPAVLCKNHEGCISSCAFSADGSMLVSGGYDMSLVIWDVDNGIHKLKLQGHDDWIEDVAFNQNQDWIVSCSKDHDIRLWNLEEADMIPAVLENKKSLGLKILTCTSCSKPFSIQTVEDSKTTICVFCRMESRHYPGLQYNSDTPLSTPPATD